jgi:hypothetical protein
MKKKGVDIELEKLTNDFLKANDTDKKKTYLSDRQMERRQKREIPISNLSKKHSATMNNVFSSTVEYED